jgi:hypothetical protein
VWGYARILPSFRAGDLVCSLVFSSVFYARILEGSGVFTSVFYGIVTAVYQGPRIGRGWVYPPPIYTQKTRILPSAERGIWCVFTGVFYGIVTAVYQGPRIGRGWVYPPPIYTQNTRIGRGWVYPPPIYTQKTRILPSERGIWCVHVGFLRVGDRRKPGTTNTQKTERSGKVYPRTDSAHS